MPSPRYVLIANPGSKRCDLYHRELLQFWTIRRVSVDVQIVPWADVVPRDGNLDGIAAFDRPAIVRMESPGKSDSVTKLLLEAGARSDPTEPRQVWQDLEIPRGLIVRPGLVYKGFCRVLRGLRQSFDTRPHLTPTACPLTIAEMFDKTQTSRTLEHVGIPVPELAPEQTTEYVDRYFNGSRYLKLNSGSSATGIVQLHHTERYMSGRSTVAFVDGHYYNTRLVQELHMENLWRVIEFLLAEGAILQKAIPLTQLRGQNFDVRVVCLYGEPIATIFRVSSHPMTNLHLGGRRGDWAECRAVIPTREWLDGLDHATSAAACFDSAIAGVDLLFERGTFKPFVLEVNAFGDFFPGWLNSSGQSIPHIEIEATARKYGFL